MEHHTDPQRHIAAARASLLANVGELGRRFQAARARFDVRARIVEHPMLAVGAAAAAGALLALGRGRSGGGEGRGGAVVAALAALGVRLAKELALREATDATRRWWEREYGEGGPEARASRDPAATEPFLEH